MTLLSRANVHDPGSFSNRMRSRRFAIFDGLVRTLPRPVRILDVGGTNEFWERRGWAGREDVLITTVNLQAEPRAHANIDPRKGNATAMPEYGDGSFDIVFSNSVIEHLFTWEAQERMASEVRRIARAYWVQTPNFWFPIEPHFLFPAWHWMPEDLRVALIRRKKFGWTEPIPDPVRAREVIREIRLLTGAEMRRLFPAATIMPERFGGLVKSWVAHHGFGPGTP